MKIKNSKLLFIVASRGTVIFSRLLSILLLTNELGITNYGIYTFVMSVIFITALIGNFGYGYSNIFFLAKDPNELGKILGNSILLSLISGIILGVIFQLLPIVFYKLFIDIPSILIKVIGFSIPISILHRYLIDITNGIENYKLYFISFSSGWLLNLLYLIVLWIFDNITLINSIYSMVLANIIIIIIVLTNLISKNTLKLKISISLFRKQLIYGFPLYFRDFFNQINFRFVYLLIKYFLNSSTLGIFAVAVQAAELLLFIPRAGFTLLFPKFSKKSKNKEINFLPVLKQFSIYFSFIIGLSYFLYPLIIKYLFYSDYLKSILPFRILLFGVFCIGILNIIESYLLSQNRQNITTKASAISAVLLFLFSMLIIPQYGIIGAALVSSIIYFIYLIITIYLSREIFTMDTK